MQKNFTEDQEQFREVVARFLQSKSQPVVVRKLMAADKGYDESVWQQLAAEVGLAGTHIPEEYGGFGFGPIELGITAEEMGRHLYCGPFFASAVMAASAILIAGAEEAKSRLLPDIASGSVIATLVMDDLNSPDRVGRALNVIDGVLNGSAGIVVDGQNADLFVVIATHNTGLGLYTVEAGTQGITLATIEALDATRKLASVSFLETKTTHIGDVSPQLLQTIWDYVCTALAHEMIGGAQHLLDTTVAYTKMRYQFGRPIGSFQGLKHRLAELLMELEMAKALTHHAAFCLAANDGEGFEASMAKAMASDVYMKAAREAVQMRGGIGFTWEEDTHLWFKRAKSSEVFMGTPPIHRERVMCVMEVQQ